MKSDLNFMPEDYLEKKAQKRTNIICLFLFLIVSAGVGAGFVITEKRQKAVRKESDKVNKMMSKAGTMLKRFEALEKKKKEILEKASVSAKLMEPVPRSLLLATITNDLPAGVSLLSYKLSSKEIIPAPSRKKIRNKKALLSKKKKNVKKKIIIPRLDVSIEVTGLAQTDKQVSEVIGALNKSRLFSQVNLSFTKEYKSKDELIRFFKIIIKLAPNARADEKDVEMARHKHISGM